MACIGAISASHGKELFEFTEVAFSSAQVASFLRQLDVQMHGRPWFAFLDNASIHKTLEVKTAAAELGVPLIFNVVTSWPTCAKVSAIT